ncbi:sulfurtransferase TusA family protein [Pararhizobium sp.]|uniref:sulfurtransferase TusA family protein n=1 Tax=Pararhizobium sp. TaxID=1977563 RepID=UPI002715AA4B|nr:sulfurtransferase TusA family protein [Pararhizobium sp.]MDO9417475.1 sulfurtransferase TusA family protein [Pararhizobium sp.]
MTGEDAASLLAASPLAVIDYDLKGLKCPLPVLKARKKLQGLEAGALLRIETTDPLAVIDIPHFCREDGHVLESSERLSASHRFLIRKNA